MNWRELAAVANQRVLLGLGQITVALDKRGLELSQPTVELSVPPEGERFSDDGTVGYLSGRITE